MENNIYKWCKQKSLHMARGDQLGSYDNPLHVGPSKGERSMARAHLPSLRDTSLPLHPGRKAVVQVTPGESASFPLGVTEGGLECPEFIFAL